MNATTRRARRAAAGTTFLLALLLSPPGRACDIVCPNDLWYETDPGKCSSSLVAFTPGTTGGCVDYTCSPPSGSTFPVGTTTVTCQLNAGPSCSFRVHVTDFEDPRITSCGTGGISKMTAGGGTMLGEVTFPLPTVTDNCTGLSFLQCTPASGSSFPVGTTIVSCAASDMAYNWAYCAFPVKVLHTTCTGLPGGLVARYRADYSVLDDLGSHNATLQHEATFGPGWIGGAFSLDGLDDMVTTTLDVKPSTMPATTWAAWIKPTTLTAGHRQTIFGDDDGEYDRTLVIEPDGTLGVFAGAGNGSSPVGRMFQPLQAGQWQHVVLAYWANQYYPALTSLTLNALWSGNLVGGPLATQTTTKGFTIGNNPTTTGEAFGGRIDEVEVYDHVLTEREVDSIYATQMTAPCFFAEGFENGLALWSGHR